MSLLEDVFLQDEADEAQDLERIIEGDGFEDQERNEEEEDDDDGNAEGRDDEAEEDKRRVDPNSTKTKKAVRNPRFVLNPARLTGPRGIQVIPEHFKNFKFKGKGHEKEDLDLVLKKLEHWAYRLYPKFKFEDCLKKMEILGKKRTVMVHLNKIRSDQYSTEDTIIQKDSSDDEAQHLEPGVQEQDDEFDKLLQQQIDLAHTPASVKMVKTAAGDIGTPMSMPKATSSPSISEEQKHRMLQNRAMAEQRRLARLKQVSVTSGTEKLAEAEASVDLTANEKIVTNNEQNGGNIENTPTDNDVVMIVDDQQHKIPKETNIDLTNENYSRTNTREKLFEINKQANSDDTESVVDVTEKRLEQVNKRKRSNVYDSSDDDDDTKTSDAEPISIENDNEFDMLVSKKTDKNRKSGDKTVFNEDITVDLTEISVKQSKRPRKAVIDSSDDECDVTADDISITVDIHRENSQTHKDRVSDKLIINEINTVIEENSEESIEKDDSFNVRENLDHIKEQKFQNNANGSNITPKNNSKEIDGSSFGPKIDLDKITINNKETNKTNEDKFERQMSIKGIATSDSRFETNEDLLKKPKNIDGIVISDNRRETNEDRFEKQTNISGIVTSDDQIETNEEKLERQNNIDGIETSDNRIDNETEICDIDLNITSKGSEKSKSNVRKSLDSSTDMDKEYQSSFENISKVGETNIANDIKEHESVKNNVKRNVDVDDVMDVDFSEEF